MKHKLLLCILSLLFCCCNQNSFLQNYNLVLDETFKGTELNKNLWADDLEVFGRKHNRYHNESYLNFLSSTDVLFEPGKVRLRNRKLFTEDRIMNMTHSYTSGMISTCNKFSFLYGYVEIKAKYSGGNGIWPCFWLMPQDETWPPEFDIAEYYASQKKMHMGLCYGDWPSVNWDSDGVIDEKFETQYNTYGLLWEPSKATWYFNNKPMRTIEQSYVPSKPMYIIISNGVSSRFGPSGEPDESTVFPNYVDVLYVKVYQK